jgi:hypothetical protein
MTALYITIWLGLALFVAGEYGKRRRDEGRPCAPFLAASAAGLVLTSIHLVLALAINNDWSHQVAWRVTEDRMRAMFGFGWGGALAGNYLFVAVWSIDLLAWRRTPQRRSNVSGPLRWGVRMFYLGIIVPAAIVFAAGPRRWMGAAVVLALMWVWRPTRTAG